MTDYTELVKALRRCAEPGTIIDECDTFDDCPYSLDGYCGDCMNNLVKDAAAAIEELQSILTEADKKQAYQHDYICELVAEKEELQAETERLKAQLPKRGEWICDDKRCIYVCSVCGSPKVRENMDRQIIKEQAYCYSCGAKMEVQDADK